MPTKKFLVSVCTDNSEYSPPSQTGSPSHKNLMIREKLLFTITKLIAFFLAGCPPQKCRFFRECELYQETSEACNRWEYRFFPDGRAYCGRWRERR